MSPQTIQYITIPKVSVYTSARYIAQMLLQHRVAVVRCVKFISFRLDAGYFKRAIIQVACWMNSPTAKTIQEHLHADTLAHLVHKDDNKWSIKNSTENEKNANARECVFFKMHNLSKSEFFKGGVQDAVLVQPVGKRIENAAQYVYYNEPSVLGAKIDWSKRSPLELLEHLTNTMDVLEKEENRAIKDLIMFTMMCESVYEDRKAKQMTATA
jgi:hypothetical protein